MIMVLCGDFYGGVKLAADSLSITTQCLKWKNIEKMPSGFCYNIMLKVNSKLGGLNHTLISRASTTTGFAGVFQDPPASLGWVFDVPCMVIS